MLVRCLAGLTLTLIQRFRPQKNGAELADVTSEVTEEADGYTVRVYNPGQEGDIVEVDLVWN